MEIWLTIVLLTLVHVRSKLFPVCDETVKRINPKATIYTDAKEHGNKTTGYRVLSSSAVTVTLKCFENFPIEWVFDSDMEAGNDVRETAVFNTREYKNFHDRKTYSYRSYMNLHFASRVTKTQIFSCQKASSPCKRRLFTSKPVQGGFYTDIYWESQLNIPELFEQQETINLTCRVGNKCDALYYYGLSNSQWSFCCKTANNESGISVLYSAKDGSTLDNIQRKSPLQPPECATQVEDLSSVCERAGEVTLQTLKGYGIKCGITTTTNLHHPIIKVRQSIYQGIENPPKIYFDWNDINPEDMIKFEVRNPLLEFVNQTVSVKCLISLSYFAHGGFIGLLDSVQGLIVHKGKVNWSNDNKHYINNYNAYKVEKALRITTTTLALYCVAPVFNNTQWVNKSVPVTVLEPLPLKITNLRDNEKITWNIGDQDRTLDCKVTGKPIDEIQWIFQNKVAIGSVANGFISNTKVAVSRFEINRVAIGRVAFHQGGIWWGGNAPRTYLLTYSDHTEPEV